MVISNNHDQHQWVLFLVMELQLVRLLGRILLLAMLMVMMDGMLAMVVGRRTLSNWGCCWLVVDVLGRYCLCLRQHKD
jgi:hypothetical protein